MINNELMTATQMLGPTGPLFHYYVYKYMSLVLLDKLALAHKPNFVESSKLVWVGKVSDWLWSAMPYTNNIDGLQMAAIWQMTFSGFFSCTKICVFWFQFHWNLFPMFHFSKQDIPAVVQLIVRCTTGDKPLSSILMHIHIKQSIDYMIDC